MDRIASVAGQEAWSEDDMRKLCVGKVEVMTVTDAVNKGSIDAVLGPHGAAILLFETEPNYGHWVALIRVDKNTMEWFDSYGIAPEGELKFIPPGFRKKSKQDYPYLTDMIREGGYTRLLYNSEHLQSSGSNTSTCGRWASMRVALKHFPLETFVKLFTGQKLKPDQYIALLTLFVR